MPARGAASTSTKRPLVEQPEQYSSFGAGFWILAAVSLLIALVLLRLLFRERITLQGSMSYLSFLLVLGAMAVFPDLSSRIAHRLGFTLLSNFIFCTAIVLLAVLHLRALVLLSKIHLRSIALTQDLAILQERLDRIQPDHAVGIAPPAAPAPEPGASSVP
jgi:hypothetical protein